MQPVPPKAMERVVGWLIPPACREEVLGDLHERYTSPRQYFLDVARTVPLVVVSQIRRTADAQVLLIEAFALYLPFLAAAWVLGGLAFLYEQSGFLRLAIPAVTALGALILGDAYADRRKPENYQAMRGAALGGASACLSQIVIWAVNAGLLVPRQMLIFGASLSVLLLSVLRMLFRREGREAGHVMPGGAAPGTTAEGSKDMSLDEIRRKSKDIQRKAWGDTLGGILGIVAVLGMVFLFWKVVERHTASDRMIDVAIAAVALFVAYQLIRTRPSGSVPPGATFAMSVEVYRAQLERRRDALRGMRLWYAGPLLGIMLAFALRVPLAHLDHPGLWLNITPFTVLAVAWAITLVYISEHRARKVQYEMDALETVEKRQG